LSSKELNAERSCFVCVRSEVQILTATGQMNWHKWSAK